MDRSWSHLAFVLLALLDIIFLATSACLRVSKYHLLARMCYLQEAHLKVLVPSIVVSNNQSVLFQSADNRYVQYLAAAGLGRRPVPIASCGSNCNVTATPPDVPLGVFLLVLLSQSCLTSFVLDEPRTFIVVYNAINELGYESNFSLLLDTVSNTNLSLHQIRVDGDQSMTSEVGLPVILPRVRYVRFGYMYEVLQPVAPPNNSQLGTKTVIYSKYIAADVDGGDITVHKTIDVTIVDTQPPVC